MPKKSKLKEALDAYQGVDYKRLRDRKVAKQASKLKRTKASLEDEDGHQLEETADLEDGVGVGSTDSESEDILAKDEDDEEDNGAPNGQLINVDMIDESDSESDHDSTSQNGSAINETDEENAPAEAGDVPLSDIESLDEDEKEDIIPFQRLTINNTSALLKALRSITVSKQKLPFSELQSITSSQQVTIADIDDDLTRELEFYKQSLTAVVEARGLLRKEGVPFSRPKDYFAEMVKSDEHMGKIKQKLIDEAASKKASTDAKRQRDLKKFGKQVQIAKIQERDKAKRETLDKIGLLKRKRQGADMGTTNEDDLFDISLDNETKTARREGKGRSKIPSKRQKRDEKFGFGGKKRFSKSGDAISSGDLRSFSVSKMKPGMKISSNRPGKSRRQKQG